MSTKVFTNAKVFTSAGDGTLQEALVIQDDKVLFVGSAEEAKALGDKVSWKWAAIGRAAITRRPSMWNERMSKILTTALRHYH